jgi:hypothetical protein
VQSEKTVEFQQAITAARRCEGEFAAQGPVSALTVWRHPGKAVDGAAQDDQDQSRIRFSACKNYPRQCTRRKAHPKSS